ncbi:hypothetical protein EYC80_011121 [Monilinia laxa]|uniref:Rhodopsin domain-containing protein n=1 Tax=Monilinia laxa TaxID=61186 RepID=A0A5N6JRQ8_MONLA|nr:hypothetical protein EYC80_011121 [Monilinia laxa]
MSASEIPTPIYPGVELDANQGPYVNALVITFTAISFITICLRLFSRWWTKIEMWWDDYLILFAAALCWTLSALLIVEAQQNFFGQHIGKSDRSHLTSFMKIMYGAIILYTIALTSSKLSLLALYWRIFRGSTRQWPIIVAVAVNIVWMLVTVCMSIFICNPIRGFWDFGIPSKCFAYNKGFIVNEGLTITLDIVVLVMPAYFISSIKRSLSQKISISSTFLVGLIVTIISIIRLWKLIVSDKRLAYGFDPTFNEVESCVWGAVEINLWVVVASIPTLRPLLGKVVRNMKESRTTIPNSVYLNSFHRGARTGFRSSGHSEMPLDPTLASSDPQSDFGDYNVLVNATAKEQERGSDLSKRKNPSPGRL